MAALDIDTPYNDAERHAQFLAPNEPVAVVQALDPAANQESVKSLESDILREQLEYLIDHASYREHCGCTECQRYSRVRAILTEIYL